MNFRLCGDESVILMSRRVGAPYADEVDEQGQRLIYEGHDVPRTAQCPDPKTVDQPELHPGGSLTQNGLFIQAIRKVQESGAAPERVRVFEKIRDGIWTYNGVFELVGFKADRSSGRKVFKFELRLIHSDDHTLSKNSSSDEDRVIPSRVKLAVWKRDHGRCLKCGAETGLHFDHIIPYSKGGSSKDPSNIQILCGRHNLEKSDRIE